MSTPTDSIFLVISLIFLVLTSAFFSSSETGMMAVNRYRIRYLAKKGQKSAARVSYLLERPDRLLGVILTGNTFANILASSIATVLAIQFFGELGVAVATVGLTFVILIIGEMTPKTIAALHAEKVAGRASFILLLLLKILYPVVWVITSISNALLKVLGVGVGDTSVDRLSLDELRSVVLESSGRISKQHQDMLLRILEMEKVTVDDIMVPRNEIVGIDLNDSWDSILEQLTQSQFSKLPLFYGEADEMIGILHTNDALKLLSKNQLDKTNLTQLVREPYYIPEGTSLHLQLLNFRSEQRRTALVVDEYGDIQGLISFEDVLEEIVGEFKGEDAFNKLITHQTDGSYLIDGSVNIRELNRQMNWQLPMDGPKTLSGLITEYLETIPQEKTCLRLAGYPIEIIRVNGNLVKLVSVKKSIRPEYTEIISNASF